jgi:uncharacterized repeat protein (TIGR03847 family)
MNPIEFGDVDVFTAGAVGQPGRRVFYLQARRGDSAASVRCEKQQVALLGQYLTKVLADLPPTSPRAEETGLELHEPLDAMFVLGPIGVAIDPDDDRIVLQLVEMRADDEDEDDEDDVELDLEPDDRSALRVSLTRDQAMAFCKHAADVVAAGRPACRWCSRPVDADGHLCPTMN